MQRETNTTQNTTPDFDAALTPQEAENIERERKKRMAGMSRRLTLTTMTKSKDELVNAIIGMGPEAFDEMLVHIDSFKNEVAMMSEIVETAQARYLIAAEEAARRLEQQ